MKSKLLFFFIILGKTESLFLYYQFSASSKTCNFVNIVIQPAGIVNVHKFYFGDHLLHLK